MSKNRNIEDEVTSRIIVTNNEFEGTVVIDFKNVSEQEMESGVKVVIPSSMGTSISGIRLCNEVEGLKIKELVFSDGIQEIKRGALKDVIGLNNVVILGNIEILPSIETNAGKIKNVYIKNVKFINTGAFSCNERLKTVKFKNQPLVIGDCAFKGCSKLSNIQELLGEGLIDVCEEAFKGCKSLHKESIILPKSLNCISTSAFSNCGLNQLEIKGKTAIAIDELNGDIAVDHQFMSECTGGKLICPHDYPYKYLRRITSENVKIVRGEREDTNEKIDNKVNKMAILGIDTRVYDVPANVEQAINTLKLMDNEVFKKDIINMLNILAGTERCTSSMNMSLIGTNGFYINVYASMDSFDYEYELKLIKGYTTENYAIIIFNRIIVVGVLSVEGIIRCLASKPSLYDEYTEYLNYPMICINNTYADNIKCIHEKNTVLTIEYKNGSSVDIDYNSILE